MTADNSVLDSLRRAVEATPDDVPLRVHLASMLLEAGLRDEAVRQVGAVLQRDPGNSAALQLLQPLGPVQEPQGLGLAGPQPAGGAVYDWSLVESEVRDVVPPMFVSGTPADEARRDTRGDPHARAFDVERPSLRIADVAGMTEVKQRLEAAFLAPMRNPELHPASG